MSTLPLIVTITLPWLFSPSLSLIAHSTAAKAPAHKICACLRCRSGKPSASDCTRQEPGKGAAGGRAGAKSVLVDTVSRYRHPGLYHMPNLPSHLSLYFPLGSKLLCCCAADPTTHARPMKTRLQSQGTVRISAHGRDAGVRCSALFHPPRRLALGVRKRTTVRLCARTKNIAAGLATASRAPQSCQEYARAAKATRSHLRSSPRGPRL